MSLGVFPIGIDPDHVLRTIRTPWVQVSALQTSVCSVITSEVLPRDDHAQFEGTKPLSQQPIPITSTKNDPDITSCATAARECTPVAVDVWVLPQQPLLAQGVLLLSATNCLPQQLAFVVQCGIDRTCAKHRPHPVGLSECTRFTCATVSLDATLSLCEYFSSTSSHGD